MRSSTLPQRTHLSQYGWVIDGGSLAGKFLYALSALLCEKALVAFRAVDKAVLASRNFSSDFEVDFASTKRERVGMKAFWRRLSSRHTSEGQRPQLVEGRLASLVQVEERSDALCQSAAVAAVMLCTKSEFCFPKCSRVPWSVSANSICLRKLRAPVRISSSATIVPRNICW
jgi:hypothetical protein